MSDVVIQVENLSKQYMIGGPERAANMRELLTKAITPWKWLNRADRQPKETFWALKDVSFEVKRGEVVGVIGRNGAGKSTLLKVLSRITEPTAGKVMVKGRMGTLLEVGTGFHPELTGRENILMNGAILGMRKSDIQARFDEIVAFAEVERFVDTPVKFYSSGMYLRLAFAVAAHLEPEILIVDEVLAVGDMKFQEKCINKMSTVAKAGKTVLFVSHNLAAVQNLCTSGVVLHAGSITSSGPICDQINYYVSDGHGSTSNYVSLDEHPGRQRNSAAKMKWVEIRGGNGQECDAAIQPGKQCKVTIGWTSEEELSNVVLGIVVKTALGNPLFGANSLITGKTLPGRKTKRGETVFSFESLPLLPGNYYMDLYFGDGHVDCDIVKDAVLFDVQQGDVFETGRVLDAAAGPIFAPSSCSMSYG